MKLAALIKKEFHRFFHDPRLIVTMLLPGILIYVIYSIMGGVIHDHAAAEDYKFNVYVQGQSEAIETIETAAEQARLLPAETVYLKAAVDLSHIAYYDKNGEGKTVYDAAAAQEAVKNGDITAFLCFSEEGTLTIYYRSVDGESSAFRAFVLDVMHFYDELDLSDVEAFTASFTSGILPFIVVVFIFSACMSITLESMAGEKERGTLSTVLVTSVKRYQITLGKVIPLSCIASIGAASSFIGVACSMPSLMGVSIGGVFGSIGFVGFLLLFLLILSVVPLIVSLICVVSAYAKSVKEASAYTSVVMILIMILSLVSTFLSGIGAWTVAVPVLNAVVCMQGILAMNMSIWQSVVSVVLNFVYTALLVLLISKMISSEKIMFGS